jgi:uncharacterized SAM-binding protein YcdF (DUF218 family)
MPLPLVCECFLLGWVLYRFTAHKKTGRVFCLLSFILFLLFGYGFGRTFLYNLERRYPPFEPTPEQCEVLRGASVVVLGQGMPEKSDLPVRYQNNPVFECRLLEGLRVAKLIPESRLIVSMAGEAPDNVKQSFLDEYMALVNFPTNRVSMFTTARDTSEEAKLAKSCVIGTFNKTNENGSILGYISPTNALINYHTNELNNTLPRIVLATSASHIPRAMKIFQKQGMNPIAAPCDYTDVDRPRLKFKNEYQWPLPKGENIEHSERALYEWLGNLYESLF